MDDADYLGHGFSEVTLPGSNLVNLFPILRYVPKWFPGASWKRRMAEIAAVSRRIVVGPFRDAMQQTVRPLPPFIVHNWKRFQNGQSQHELESVAARLIEGLPPPAHPDYL
ncbi:cytochrome P450 [Coprinopsis cinerea AmutBmut pab1-1]|nr:cytochrome P450 [Coprinopsis cinerea AmutBmut pab1-1]